MSSIVISTFVGRQMTAASFIAVSPFLMFTSSLATRRLLSQRRFSLLSCSSSACLRRNCRWRNALASSRFLTNSLSVARSASTISLRRLASSFSALIPPLFHFSAPWRAVAHRQLLLSLLPSSRLSNSLLHSNVSHALLMFWLLFLLPAVVQ